MHYTKKKHETFVPFVSNFYLNLPVNCRFSFALRLLDCSFEDKETSDRRDREASSNNLQGRNSVLFHKINNKSSCIQKPNFYYKKCLPI
jgi:hypothetical protein